MQKYKFKIKNLDCATCASNLETALHKISIIENISISFMTERLSFECLEENKEEASASIKEVIKRTEPDVQIEEL